MIRKNNSKFNENLEIFYEKNIDVDSRTIYFGAWQGAPEAVGEVEWSMDDLSVQNIIKGLYILDKINHEPITILLASDGGTWESGIALYDYIRELKSYVTMICYGRVRSMGTIVLQACDERILTPNCSFLIHYGTVGTEPSHSQDFLRTAEQVEKENKIMENIYLEKIKEKNPKYSLKQLRNALKYDKFLTAQEAIDLGLADGIKEREEEE